LDSRLYGTSIKKWHRVDAGSGLYFWEDLSKQYGAAVSEVDFRKFVIGSIQENPNVLPLESANPWLAVGV